MQHQPRKPRARQNTEMTDLSEPAAGHCTEDSSEISLPTALPVESTSDYSGESPSRHPLGEGQSVHVAPDPARIALAVTVNLLVLAQVFIAMYLAAKTPETITPEFFKILFSMLLPTLAVAFIIRRVLARREKP